MLVKGGFAQASDQVWIEHASLRARKALAS
jgi:hypothetical protein